MSDRIRVATRKGLFTITRRNGRWTVGDPAFLGDPVTAVLDDAGTLYAALNLGHFGVKVRRSRDEGKTWDDLPAPVYPPQPENAPGSPWKLVLIWTLEAGGDNSAGAPRTLWAGTLPGGLFRSVDQAQSWELVRPLWDRTERTQWSGGGYDHPGIHSIVIDPRDSNRLTLGVSCGGVWQSNDAGANWQLSATGMRAAYMPPDQAYEPNVQDPHRIVACAAQPDTLWCQHHNGIFKSTDGAASWQEITTTALSGFGFAVGTHPRDPDSAWFVPAVKDETRVPVGARLAVTRTRDGGRSFEVLTDGLPDAPCYDLIYRHGLAVDAGGQQLAIGSTSGGLWLSENGGDAWQCVSVHLPPVYAVRFVD